MEQHRHKHNIQVARAVGIMSTMILQFISYIFMVATRASRAFYGLLMYIQLAAFLPLAFQVVFEAYLRLVDFYAPKCVDQCPVRYSISLSLRLFRFSDINQFPAYRSYHRRDHGKAVLASRPRSVD
jgi:hypothetical protein